MGPRCSTAATADVGVGAAGAAAAGAACGSGSEVCLGWMCRSGTTELPLASAGAAGGCCWLMCFRLGSCQDAKAGKLDAEAAVGCTTARCSVSGLERKKADKQPGLSPMAGELG
jgi:hypothetical protein